MVPYYTPYSDFLDGITVISPREQAIGIRRMNLTHEHFGQPFVVTTCLKQLMCVAWNYQTFMDVQEDTRELQGLLILAIFDRSESLSVVAEL